MIIGRFLLEIAAFNKNSNNKKIYKFFWDLFCGKIHEENFRKVLCADKSYQDRKFNFDPIFEEQILNQKKEKFEMKKWTQYFWKSFSSKMKIFLWIFFEYYFSENCQSFDMKDSKNINQVKKMDIWILFNRVKNSKRFFFKIVEKDFRVNL